MVTFSAPKINDLQFSKCILCVEPRFSAMMMSFESTIVSPLDGSFRCQPVIDHEGPSMIGWEGLAWRDSNVPVFVSNQDEAAP